MNAFDFAPLFRTAIGFDRLARMMDTVAASAEAILSPVQYREDRRGQLSSSPWRWPASARMTSS